MKYGIVAIGYNRLNSLKRLLNQLSVCSYDEEVTLFVSIDKSNVEDVAIYAENFNWEHGGYHVIKHNERMGLRNHILSCGDLLNKYDVDAIAVFEDDILPGKAFFKFMKQAVEFYGDDDSIAGISLYRHAWYPGVRLPFIPQTSEYDVYFMKVAQSWGQVWTKKQWTLFRNWYNENSEQWNESKYVPDYIAKWPNTSWLKYYCRYCAEKEKYFVYPYNSFTTCCSEIGEHTIRTSTAAQVPVMQKFERDYNFVKTSDNNAVRYDAFWESENIKECIAERFNFDISDITIDIYGTNGNALGTKYFLTMKQCPYKVIDSYALNYKPHENNILFDIKGNDIYLYDTTVKSSQKNKKCTRKIEIFEYYTNSFIDRRTINLLYRSAMKRSVSDFIKTIKYKRRKRK